MSSDLSKKNYFKLINNCLKNNYFVHAYLIEIDDYENDFKDVLTLVKALLCQNKDLDDVKSLNCDKCNICSLIDNDNYPDLYIIEGNDNLIKKEQIIKLEDDFKNTSLLKNKRIYIIKESEKMNDSSSNTLLKFLEEPEDNIIGFFITNNKENVISTIRSRCQIISCNYDVSLDSFLSDEVLNDVKIYLNSIYKNKNDLLYNKTNMSGYYKDRKDWEIFFKTMLYYIRDCMETDRIDKIDMVKDLSNANLVKIILKIEEILKYIKSNGNIDLILDKFVIEMRDLYE